MSDQALPPSLDEQVAQLMAGPWPVPVITQPEDLPPTTLLPYEKQYRVPEPLVPLEEAVAAALRVDVQQLVIIEGSIAGERLAAWFEVRAAQGVERVWGYVVAYKAPDRKLLVIPTRRREPSEKRWREIEHSVATIRRALEAAAVLAS